MKLTIFVGGQGVGKTIAAKKLADSMGTYVITKQNELLSAFGFGEALRDEPQTLIIDEAVLNEALLTNVFHLISNDRATIETKYAPQRTVRVPRIIICTQSFNLELPSAIMPRVIFEIHHLGEQP